MRSSGVEDPIPGNLDIGKKNRATEKRTATIEKNLATHANQSRVMAGMSAGTLIAKLRTMTTAIRASFERLNVKYTVGLQVLREQEGEVRALRKSLALKFGRKLDRIANLVQRPTKLMEKYHRTNKNVGRPECQRDLFRSVSF